MNALVLEKNIRFLIYQRNVLVAISILVSLSLVMTSTFLFLKSERIVITPPIIEKEFWVDSNGVSPTYLEQMGCFLGNLLLNKSLQSAPLQRAVLLRHTDSSYVGILRQKLIEEEEALKKQNTSYVFFPKEAKVNLQALEVVLLGDRQAYVAGKQVSSESEGYILHFTYSNSKLLLQSLSSYEGSKSGAT